MNRKISIEIEVDAGGAVTGIRSVGGELVQFERQGTDAVKRFSRSMDVAFGNIAAGLVSKLTGALANVPDEILRIGSAAEAQLADLEAITGITGRDLERLGQTAIRESIRTGVAAQDQIEAYKILASSIDIASIGGVKGLEQLGAEVVTLSQAAKLDLAVAADVVAGSLNQFGLAASESERIVNVLAAGSKFGQAGKTASLAKLSFEETVGVLEVMSQSTLRGSEAGVGLRNVITILRTESEKLAKAGIKDVNLESDGLTATLQKLKPLLNDSQALVKIFGRENLNAALVLIQNADAVGTMTESVTDTNTAMEQAAIQANTFTGLVARLRSALEAIAIETFQDYKDELNGVVSSMIEAVLWLRENRTSIMATAKVLLALTAGVVAYNAVVKTQAIITSAATIAQKALNFAMRLNPIGLVVAALAVIIPLLIQFRGHVAQAGAVFLDFGAWSVRAIDMLIEKFQALISGVPDWVPGIEKLRAATERLSVRADNTAEGFEYAANMLRRYSRNTLEVAAATTEGSKALDENSKKTEDNTDAADENAAALAALLAKEKEKTDATKKSVLALKELDGSLSAINNNLQVYREQLDKATTDEARQGIVAHIQALEAQKGAIEKTTKALEVKKEKLKELDGSLAAINNNLQVYRERLEAATDDAARKGIQDQITALEAQKTAIENVLTAEEKKAEAAKKAVDAEKQKAQALLESTAQTIASTDTSIKSAADAANAVITNARKIVQAKLAEAIAGAIAPLGPLAVFLAPVVAAGINLIFNRLVPQFAGGVTNFPGGLALVGERGPEIVTLPGGSNVLTNENTRLFASALQRNLSLGVQQSTRTPGLQVDIAHEIRRALKDVQIVVSAHQVDHEIQFRRELDDL